MAVNTENDKVGVGISSTEIVPEREHRLLLVLSNDSANTIYLGFGEAAVLNEGIRLASGASLIVEEKDKLNVAVNGISSAVGDNVAYFDHYQDAL